MNKHILLSLTIAAALLGATANADTLTTKTGASITGTITKIDKGEITVETPYAGTLTVKQSEVTDILAADNIANIRRTDGTSTLASIDSRQTPTATIASTWPKDAPDPAIEALKRKWSFEAAVDITGKNGNSDQFGSAVSLRAKLAGPKDALNLYAAYDYQKTDGVRSADLLRVGADYQHQITTRLNWYVRDELGYDKVKDIDTYNVAAAGFGYVIIGKEKHNLTVRAGLSHRYETYGPPVVTGDPQKENLSDIGLDFGLHHDWTFSNSKIVTNITYTPSLENRENYRAFHETYYELPIAASLWKFRIGISNDFNSDPGPHIDKMDTTYFARLVLSWQ